MSLSTMTTENRSSITVFRYLYRDAGNYKAFGSLILRGAFSSDQLEELVSCLEEREFFVAEQVDIKPLYVELYGELGGANTDDHPWHTFVGLESRSAQLEEENPTRSVSSLLAVFGSAHTNWRPELSPHFYRN